MLASPGGKGKNFSPLARRRDLASRLGSSSVEEFHFDFSYFLSISFSGLDQYPSSKASFFKVKLKLLLQMTTEKTWLIFKSCLAFSHSAHDKGFRSRTFHRLLPNCFQCFLVGLFLFCTNLRFHKLIISCLFPRGANPEIFK